jgi:hypothetical protein
MSVFRRFALPSIVFFLVFCSVLGGFLYQQQAKAEDSQYHVQGIEVDVLDESSVKARNKAFIEAQRKAFMVLAERFVSDSQLKSVVVPPQNTLSEYIQDFRIAQEQVSSKRYKGTFDFRFKPSVDKLFGSGPTILLEAENNKPELLIIPFYNEEKKGAVFNKEQNPFWRSLSDELKKSDEYKKIILPEANIQDFNDIGDKNPKMLTADIIRRIKIRYDVEHVLIAIASVSLADQTIVAVEMLEGIHTVGLPRPIVDLEVPPEKIGLTTLSVAAELLKPQKPVTEETSDLLGQREEGEIPYSEINPALFDPNARRPGQQHSNQQRRNVIEASKEAQERARRARYREIEQVDMSGEARQAGEIIVQVNFKDVTEWVTWQKDMSALSGLSGIRITSLKTDEAQTVFEYFDWQKLNDSLKNSGLTLIPQSDEVYVLKRLGDNF